MKVHIAKFTADFHRQFDGRLRKETKLFDKDAFREAWLNACLHIVQICQTPPLGELACEARRKEFLREKDSFRHDFAVPLRRLPLKGGFLFLK